VKKKKGKDQGGVPREKSQGKRAATWSDYISAVGPSKSTHSSTSSQQEKVSMKKGRGIKKKEIYGHVKESKLLSRHKRKATRKTLTINTRIGGTFNWPKSIQITFNFLTRNSSQKKEKRREGKEGAGTYATVRQGVGGKKGGGGKKKKKSRSAENYISIVPNSKNKS